VADLLADPPVDPTARWGIPADQPVVVYLPLPTSTLRWHWWSHGVYTQPWPFVATERKVVKALRAYCDRTGAWLVVKGLHRRGVAPWIEALAHRVGWDTPDEPTMLRLLQATDARLMVHYLSTSVSEAAVCGVPSVCVVPPRPGWLPQYAPRQRHPAFAAPLGMGYAEARSFYCWNPAALAVSPRVLMRVARRAGLRPPHSLMRLEDYREAFFGEPPYMAGQRIIEDLEGMERR